MKFQVEKNGEPATKKMRKELSSTQSPFKPQRPAPTFPTLEKHLNQACDQLQLLQDAITQVQMRLDRCKLAGAKHSLQVRLQVLRGMYSVFYRYSKGKADAMEEMWFKGQERGAEE